MIKYWNCLVSKQDSNGSQFFFCVSFLNTQKKLLFVSHPRILFNAHVKKFFLLSTSQNRELWCERERKMLWNLLCAQSPIYIHLQQKRGLMIRDRKKNISYTTWTAAAAWDSYPYEICFRVFMLYVACDMLLSHTPTHTNVVPQRYTHKWAQKIT